MYIQIPYAVVYINSSTLRDSLYKYKYVRDCF